MAMDVNRKRVSAAIVDYGLGNLFSIKSACESVGIEATISSEKKEIENADVIFLPGVGAFGDAMAELHRLDFVRLLQDMASGGKPLVGICLGMQLMMSEGYEFGLHKGLGIIEGVTQRFKNTVEADNEEKTHLKVPHVGWARIFHGNSGSEIWSESYLTGIENQAFMYFVHSYFVVPEINDITLSQTNYGGQVFCSSIKSNNISAFQFHPERSGLLGLKIYENICKENEKE